jgi:hypothetical protein
MVKVTPRVTLENLHKVLGPEFVKQSEELQKLEQEIMEKIENLNWIEIPEDKIEISRKRIKNIMETNKVKIYLDDVRTPVDPTWKVVRNYEQFVDQATYYGLENIDIISLDHDLGPSAMQEWHTNVYHNYKLDYDNINEKTGMDCMKWLVEQWLNGAPVVDVVVHSANAVGASNIMGYCNNYRHIHHLPQNCVRVRIEHTV